VAEIITEVGADNLTAKGLRKRLEQSLGMESNALKQYKKDISTMIDEVLKVCAHSQEPVTILSACDHACRCVPMRPRIRQRRRRRIGEPSTALIALRERLEILRRLSTCTSCPAAHVLYP
jgi:hypothetical protein